MRVLVATVVAAAALVTAPPAARAADVTDGLALWYKLDATSGSAATDSSGHGRHGTVNGTAAWGDGLGFNGTDTYVRLPDNVVGGLDSITVAMDVFVDPAQATPYFIYGFGNSSGANGNGYLFATGDQLRTAIASGNWSTEQNTRPAAGRNLFRGAWKHLAYTQTGTTGVLYEDGVEVSRNSSVTITPGSIGAGLTTANYIGRSLYSGDRYFRGKVRDFRVYERAISATEVDQLATPANTRAVADDTAALSLGDTSGVTGDLALPATGRYGSRITWASSDTSVVSETGAVSRPPAGGQDARVTLTATLTRGGVSDTKTFEVTVLADFDDATKVARAAAALTVHNLDDVRGNLTLPAGGDYGTAVTWSSDRPDVVSPTGEVHRPAAGAPAASVRLVATVTLNGAETARTFTAVVPPLPPRQDLKGYMFSYFTGEGTANGEQVYFGLSHGNDPLRWRELNGGEPVLTSTLGEKGLRDPFIIRSPEGDKFYQIATDLRIFGNGDWDAAQRTGSKSIMVWESTDLVHWTDQRLVKVSPDTAGNTWAPEAYYDESLGAYVVFWASKIYAANDPGHTGDTYNKMMYATTRDFHTFSEPKVWVDPGYSVIDSTVVKHGGTYYRFTKDERNNTSSTPCSKFVLEEKSTTLLDLSWSFVADCIGKGSISQGEGPTIFKSNTEDKWYLFVDEFGGRGYIPFESTDLESGVWTMSTGYSLPSRPRHGTVLPVTQAEYDRLLRAYAADQLVESVEDVAVRTKVGTAPVLPATVVARYADGVSRPAAVTWDAVPPAAYAKPRTFTVGGAVAGSDTVRATATVTVTRRAPETPNDLVVHYKFDETDGRVARDSSGHGYHGTYARPPAWGAGVHGGSFVMSGGASSPYVSIPNGVLKDADSVTVSAYVKWPASTTVNQWLFGLGPDSDKYLFVSPSNGSRAFYSAITTGSWQAESKLSGSAFPSGSWQHVAVVVDGAARAATLYLNGVPVARAADVPAKPADLYDPAKPYSGYIGRSLYGADPYFAGEVDDFRIYRRALPTSEVLELAGNTTGIAAVTLPELKVDALVDDAASRVVLPVKPGTDLRALAPHFVLARGAKISPKSGKVRDFHKPVTYTVTGSDGRSRTWTVTATVMRSPVLPGLYADPNIAYLDGRYYIYPTTDGFAGWSGTQYKAFSSTDLVHWEDHGVVLDLGPDVTWADNSAWAPAVAARNGKYYLYFSGGMATGDTRKHLGVAVADSPTGPFHDALGRPLVPAGTYSGQMIDPAVFTGQDGQSYLYWGNGNSYQVPLDDDMVSFDPARVRTYHPANYNEGSFVVERDGVYYFMWSENDTRDENYQVAYATGDSPLGPWSERKGVILQKDLALGIKGTGHHSIIQVPGTDEWYIVYHRFAIPGGDGTHRETTIDRLEFDADGAIEKVVPTLESIDPVVNLAPTITQAAGPVGPVALGAEVTVTAGFADGNRADRHACTVDWQDGRVSAGTVTTGTCTASRVYETAGVYRPTVTVTDGRGGTATTAAGYTAVYDSGTPHVAAAGVIDPRGCGEAFGLAAGTAAGPAPIALRLAFRGKEFAATSYDRLALTRTRAEYRGTGTIDGAGGYAYTVTLTEAGRVTVTLTDARTGRTVHEARGPLTGGVVIAR
ncbi:family 43 glycosylhydrolase [Phytohabitans sp. LJ34]|uniref:family 43 glycosylhydrolase n=1 Tax=Phytohabitans sp. LJ34 TaxID=3452217 RepID=UPI003F88EDD3